MGKEAELECNTTPTSSGQDLPSSSWTDGTRNSPVLCADVTVDANAVLHFRVRVRLTNSNNLRGLLV